MLIHRTSRIISILFAWISVGLWQAHAETLNEFEPPVYSEQITLHVDGTAQEACSLLANRPRGKLVAEKSSDDEFPGDDPQAGSVYYQVISGHNGESTQENWYIPIEDNSANGVYRELWLIPNLEILVHDIRCVENSAGGADVKVRWRVVVPTPAAEVSVKAFFDKGMFSVQMKNMEKKLNEAIQKKRGDNG